MMRMNFLSRFVSTPQQPQQPLLIDMSVMRHWDKIYVDRLIQNIFAVREAPAPLRASYEEQMIRLQARMSFYNTLLGIPVRYVADVVNPLPPQFWMCWGAYINKRTSRMDEQDLAIAHQEVVAYLKDAYPDVDPHHLEQLVMGGAQ